NRTFNCGIGMVCVVARDQVAPLRRILESHGEQVFEIGRVVALSGTEPAVHIDNAEAPWGN
ncbi:MAG: phosphoribosylformylglycinamidine cyclo-ligase, partial [Rhodospirillales bacterium]|nr:phosphoribosylformylglycinamidine cyclo-ligase [Rhodospirillales bacterium]